MTYTLARLGRCACFEAVIPPVEEFAGLEVQLERQRVLEAKLIVLEDELNQLKRFRRRVEQETAS